MVAAIGKGCVWMGKIGEGERISENVKNIFIHIYKIHMHTHMTTLNRMQNKISVLQNPRDK